MNLKMLQQSDRIIFSCIAGSHAYGTSTPQSDVDIRGFFVNPSEEHLSLVEPAGQIGDEKHDITYYSLKRAFELLMKASPNMIELLYMPEDCVKIQTPAMDKLIANREYFISKKCFHTFSGYAYAQIKKAKGQNKKVHNPQPIEQPCKEDFCWVINNWNGDRAFNIDNSTFPSRPQPLKSTITDLSHFHAAKLEHADNVYRLYSYGKKAKGVFRGDQMLVPESISIDDEFDKFWGLLIYNQQDFERALNEWRSYWDWYNNRNEARWVDQESGKLNYDAKNMLHCMRLLMSGESLLKGEGPIVRFEGENLEYLMQIRSSKMPYETILADVETRMESLQLLYDSDKWGVPNKVNINKLQKLYREVRDE